MIGISVRETSAENVAAYAAKYQLGYTIAADVTGRIFDLHPTGIILSIVGAILVLFLMGFSGRRRVSV